MCNYTTQLFNWKYRGAGAGLWKFPHHLEYSGQDILPNNIFMYVARDQATFKNLLFVSF